MLVSSQSEAHHHHTFKYLHTLLLLLLLLHPSPQSLAKSLQLEILPNDPNILQGAACLDGSPPAIYINITTSPANKNKWVLYFKGGGWCVNDTDCLSRATQSLLGSSTNLREKQPTFGYGGGGPLGDDPVQNPSFAHFNRVMLWYCDGGSFSGDRSDPVPIFNHARNKTTNLYYRGRRNLVATLRYLRHAYHLGNATDVLLSGGSAGGLAVYLHADYVRSTFVPFVKFRAAPISGFFLQHNTMDDVNLFPQRSRHVFHMMNSTGGVNQNCVVAMAAAPERNVSDCFFANGSYAYTQTPMFVLNSAVDSYQMQSILAVPGDCASMETARKSGPQFNQCSAKSLAAIGQYEIDFLQDLQRTTTFRQSGNGGFIESCMEHVAAQGSPGTKIEQNGTSMAAALSSWWENSEIFSKSDAGRFWHLPCSIHRKNPGQCNPSCEREKQQQVTLV